MSAAAVDPIELQVLSGGLRSICDEMGAVLVRASYSPNIKERRDCSTALFDAGGELVMQAEHIPVHLGSMPAAVEAVAALAGEGPIAADDLWILNDPFRGGTHLPDITLVSPLPVDERLIGWVASRAHHADVGGPTPGGMPADSRSLADEGVVIEPQRADAARLEAIAARMRRPDERLADLRAQRAANLRGQARIAELAERLGRDRLTAGMAAVLDYAERRSRDAIGALADGVYEAADSLEAADGGEIALRVRVEIAGDEVAVDFGGSDPQVDGNLNCPLPVTRAATLFAIRALTDPDAPASAGAFRPVAIAAPPGCVLNAHAPAAVAAGNVETSSRVADLVLTALAEVADGPAQGQGTMNNLTLSAGSDGERVHLLRDDRRRPGRLPVGAGAERRPRGDVEHAEHARRGARERTARPRHRAGDPPRQRRRRPAPGRRRSRPQPRGAGADGVHADHRATELAGRAGGTVAATASRAATAATESRCRRSARGRCNPATCCGSRPRAAAASAAPATVIELQENVRVVTYLPFRLTWSRLAALRRAQQRPRLGRPRPSLATPP